MKMDKWFALYIIAIIGFLVGLIVYLGSQVQNSKSEVLTLIPTTEISGWQAKGYAVKYNPYDVAVKIDGGKVAFIFYKEQDLNFVWPEMVD